MLQQLAKDRGMIVEERPIDFEKEIGNFKEIGAVAGNGWRFKKLVETSASLLVTSALLAATRSY